MKSKFAGVVAAVVAPGVFLLTGCAAGPARSPAMSAAAAGERVFPLTEQQADTILLGAMKAEFGDSPIARVESPGKGYQATIKFMFDSQQVVGYMVPVNGGASTGGYYFKVTTSGTMPISGHARAKRLRERLVQGAEAESVVRSVGS